MRWNQGLVAHFQDSAFTIRPDRFICKLRNQKVMAAFHCGQWKNPVPQAAVARIASLVYLPARRIHAETCA